MIFFSFPAELCIDLSFFGAIGQRTAVTHTPDISKIDSKVQEFESEGNKVDQEVEDVRFLLCSSFRFLNNEFSRIDI